MKIKSEDFRAEEGKKVALKKWRTRLEPLYKSKEDYQSILNERVEELSSLQSLLYASSHSAMLLIFQGMDAAGKDGVIKHVLSGVNPQGCEVVSFKQPSTEELQHDFLWRTNCRLPERGRIGIFNRSYYEEVLVVKVHPENLLRQGFSESESKQKSFWKERYQSIRGMEDHLSRNNTKILKFFLHLSKDEQRTRFLDRIDQPKSNWKFGATDFAERALWKEYMDAYEDCIHATSTKQSPWYIVPADDKKNTRLLVSQIVVETLKQLKMSYPISTSAHRKELQLVRKQLAG